MAFQHGPIGVVHQSDTNCLARFRWEQDNPQPSGHFAVVGVLAHSILERFAIEQAEHPQVRPASVIREILAAHRDDPEATDDVVSDVVEIMSGAFSPDSDLRLGLPPEPWKVRPEWRWALDDELRPIPPCVACEGLGEVAGAKCPMCSKHVGWMAAPAFTGTLDRLEWNEREGRIVIPDWKATLLAESSADVEGDKQARWYVTAAFAHFTDYDEATFAKTFLRRGYAARATFLRDGAWHEATRQRMLAARARRLRAIETNVWPEQIGEACGYCPLLHRCGEQRRARESGSIPNATPTERANDWLGLREWMKVTERDLRDHVARTGEAIPLDDGDGTVLGRKPDHGWRLAKDRTYEVTMADLRRIGMTPEQEAEWFRYCGEGHFPGRVKKALEKLMGFKQASLLIEAGGWLDETVDEQFSCHVPPEREVRPEMTSAELDERLDELFAGG